MDPTRNVATLFLVSAPGSESLHRRCKHVSGPGEEAHDELEFAVAVSVQFLPHHAAQFPIERRCLFRNGTARLQKNPALIGWVTRALDQALSLHLFDQPGHGSELQPRLLCQCRHRQRPQKPDQPQTFEFGRRQTEAFSHFLVEQCEAGRKSWIVGT